MAEPVPAYVIAPSEKVAYVGGEERKAEMREILSRREFAGSDSSIIDLVSSWIKRALGGLFGSGLDAIPSSKAVSVTLAVIVLGAFLVILALVLARLGFGMSSTFEEETSDLYAGPNSPRLALDDAAKAASDGDFRSAIRLVYLAVLLRLDEREMIRFDRTGTNWEYLATLRKRPAIYTVLRPATTLFDRKWYGHESAISSDYETLLDTYGKVESAEVAE